MADTMLESGGADAMESLEEAQPAVQHLPRADEPVAAVEIYCNSFTTAAPEKLSAIAGVMSAYNRYLVGVRGRSPDDLDGKDVEQLGTMLSAMLGLEAQPTPQPAKGRQGYRR